MKIKSVYTNENKECRYSDWQVELQSVAEKLKDNKYEDIYYELENYDYYKDCLFYIIPKCATQKVALKVNMYCREEDFDSEQLLHKLNELVDIRDDFENIVKKSLDNGGWFTQAEIYYIKTYTKFGNDEFVTKANENRAKILKANEEKHEQHLKELAEKEEQRKREERERQEKEIASAEYSARNSGILSSEQFLMLCDKYNVDMCMQCLGFARKYLGCVYLKTMQYSTDKGHSSQKIFDVMQELKDKMELKYE